MTAQKAPTSRLRPDETPSALLRRRAELDFIQDLYENVPFGSVGGLDKRHDMTAPAYIEAIQRAAYLDYYRMAAARELGADWQTCTFSWKPALVINAKHADGSPCPVAGGCPACQSELGR